MRWLVSWGNSGDWVIRCMKRGGFGFCVLFVLFVCFWLCIISCSFWVVLVGKVCWCCMVFSKCVFICFLCKVLVSRLVVVIVF